MSTTSEWVLIYKYGNTQCAIFSLLLKLCMRRLESFCFVVVVFLFIVRIPCMCALCALSTVYVCEVFCSLFTQVIWCVVWLYISFLFTFAFSSVACLSVYFKAILLLLFFLLLPLIWVDIKLTRTNNEQIYDHSVKNYHAWHKEHKHSIVLQSAPMLLSTD